MSIQQAAHSLFEEQITGWPLLGENWNKLDAVRMRDFQFEGFRIRTQFNPKRITSSAAKVDKASIKKRPCFLCRENRPPEEDHVSFGTDYEILCNPFPIFRTHYTIGKDRHTPQVIDTEFFRMLDLGKALPDLVVFYNAPKCGASAPDHMHFQAGNRGFMPIEEELGALKGHYGTALVREAELEIWAVDDGLRRFFVMESGDRGRLQICFQRISTFMRTLAGGDEPMLNILCYHNQSWQVLVFPRELHRPWQFFEEGEKNILISPASVDMGGTMIIPLEKDFLKLTRDDVVDIYKQIGPGKSHFLELSAILQKQA
jgi:hypothetical protein